MIQKITIFTNSAHLDDKSDGRSAFSFEVRSEARFDVRFEAKLEAKSDIRSEVTLEAASEAIFEGSETISEATMEPRIIKTIFATDMIVKIYYRKKKGLYYFQYQWRFSFGRFDHNGA